MDRLTIRILPLLLLLLFRCCCYYVATIVAVAVTADRSTAVVAAVGTVWTQAGQFRYNFTLGTTAIPKEFFKTRAIACDLTVDSLFMFECSRLQPNLSNSFLNILLANNTVCGAVGLGN